MPACIRCNVDKLRAAFRVKTSGPLAGYRFPLCMQCEDERVLVQLARLLRQRNYSVVDTDPTRASREGADADTP